MTLADRVQAGILPATTQLVSLSASWPATATVNEDGEVVMDDQHYSSASAAALAVKGSAVNGWDFWAAVTPTGKTPLSVLRRHCINRETAPQ